MRRLRHPIMKADRTRQHRRKQLANLAEGIRPTKSVEAEVPLELQISAMSLAADKMDAWRKGAGSTQGLGIR
jgi:hypothetical protein